MTQMQMQSVARSAAAQPVSSRRFVTRFVVSSISSLAGLISFILIGPTIYHIAAVDPALEAFYGTGSCCHLVWIFGKNVVPDVQRSKSPVISTSTKPTKSEGKENYRATQLRKDVRVQDVQLARPRSQFY